MDFEEFIRAELGPLTRFAGALTGDRYAAEDMLSDALLKVASRWRRISRADDPAAYVRRVVINTYLSDLRKAKRRKTMVTSDSWLLDRPAPDMAADVAARQDVAALLARLPPQQRAAVVLRYLLDQTDDQIAAALNCSPGTVRSHLSRARATLRLAASPAGKE